MVFDFSNFIQDNSSFDLGQLHILLATTTTDSFCLNFRMFTI